MPISVTENKDCILAMREMPNKFWDLALCDVPYGLDEGNNVSKRNRSVLQKNGSRTPMIPLHKPKDWDKEQPSQDYFDEVFRVSKYQIIFGSNYISFDQKPNSSGRIFWDKVNGNSNYADGELLWTNLFTSIRQITFMWHGFCQGLSLDQPTKQRGNKKLNEKRRHPTQKPLELYFWIYKNYVQPGWKILDTHLGSQNSRYAARVLSLDFWGYEIDEEYFEDNNAWFESVTSIPKLF